MFACVCDCLGNAAWYIVLSGEGLIHPCSQAMYLGGWPDRLSLISGDGFIRSPVPLTNTG